MENLFEAFQELKILDEDVFNVTADGIEEVKNFKDDEGTDVYNDLELVIDPEAETEEELEDSYIGKAILCCDVCDSKIYKNPEEVVISEDETLANIGEICPYCQSSDGFKVIGQVAEFCPECAEEPKVETEDDVKVDIEEKEEDSKEDVKEESFRKKQRIKEAVSNGTKGKPIKKSLKEEIENLTIETDKEVINVSSQEKEESEEPKAEGETIIPVEPETEEKFTKESEDEYQDIDVDEFDEKEFDTLGEKYLRNVYENVKSFKTTKGSVAGNKLKLEGLITFKSGKQGKTNFIFEAKSVNKDGKLKFIGENVQFAKGHKTFTLNGRMEGNKLITESLTYNYHSKDNNGKSKRIYGTVKR